MKFYTLVASLLLVTCCCGQSENETEVEVKLFLSAHVKSTILPTDKLVVYMISENDTTKFLLETRTAKRVKDNVYSFTLQKSHYFRIVFTIRDYTYNMICIDNREGQATDDYSFNILLEKVKFNKEDLKYIRPCLLRD